MTRLLSEPLVHFLLIGAALFTAFSAVSGRDTTPPNAIVVSAGKVEQLASLFERTWQRPPAPEELGGLITEFVREEAAYREGMALGLDRDDAIIRRRVRQKLQFVAEDLTSAAEPSDDDLAAFLVSHPDDYRLGARLSFRQVYLSPERRGDALAGDARDLLRALEGGSSIDAGAIGDRTLLDHAYEDISISDVADRFGTEFAASVEGLAVGAWAGPIASAYGAHLVRVDAREEGRVRALSEVREQVRRDWEFEMRRQATDAFYRALVDRYDVVIERPEAVDLDP
jgi:hypothetical protein